MNQPLDKTSLSVTVIFSALFIAAALAWFFLTSPESKHIKPDEATSDHRFISLEIKQFTKTGARLYALRSPSVYHLPDEDEYHLNTPYIKVTEEQQPTWTIQSDEALITAKAEEIKFLRHVTMEHDAFEDQTAGILKTEAISYFPKQKQAKTPLAITWDQEDKHLEALGMQADLTQNQVELLQNVRARYRPAHG